MSIADDDVPKVRCKGGLATKNTEFGCISLGVEVEVVEGQSQQEHCKGIEVSVFNRQQNPSACLSYAVSAV